MIRAKTIEADLSVVPLVLKSSNRIITMIETRIRCGHEIVINRDWSFEEIELYSYWSSEFGNVVVICEKHPNGYLTYRSKNPDSDNLIGKHEAHYKKFQEGFNLMANGAQNFG